MSQKEYYKELEEYYSRFSKEELEKAKELGKKYFPNSKNIWARETYLKNIEQQKTIFACLEMAEWMDDRFYKILACIKYSLEKSGIDRVDEFVDDIKKEWEE